MSLGNHSQTNISIMRCWSGLLVLGALVALAASEANIGGGYSYQSELGSASSLSSQSEMSASSVAAMESSSSDYGSSSECSGSECSSSSACSSSSCCSSNSCYEDSSMLMDRISVLEGRCGESSCGAEMSCGGGGCEIYGQRMLILQAELRRQRLMINRLMQQVTITSQRSSCRGKYL